MGKGKPVLKTVSLRNKNISPVFIVVGQNENDKFGKTIAEETIVESRIGLNSTNGNATTFPQAYIHSSGFSGKIFIPVTVKVLQ